MNEETLLLEDDNDSLYEHYQFISAKGQMMMRVDKFLVNFLSHISRSKIQNAAELDCIHVNGKPVKSSYKVKPFDKVALVLPYPPPPELAAENIPINIHYEDEHLLLVNKKPEMVCHPSIGHHTGTLIHALLWHFEQLPAPATPQDYPRPGLVHRIDKGTSGLLLIAKTDYAMAHLAKQFFDKTTDRLYYAIVWGNVKQDEGTITGYIGRSAKDRKVFTIYDNEEQGKYAVTHYKVLERYGGIATLVQCNLETGRTHQIRVHMKHIGHTLMGDGFYGGDKQLAGQHTKKSQHFVDACLEIMKRQALHAKTLGFTHPHTNERMSFDSELPEDFVKLQEKLRNYGIE